MEFMKKGWTCMSFSEHKSPAKKQAFEGAEWVTFFPNAFASYSPTEFCTYSGPCAVDN